MAGIVVRAYARLPCCCLSQQLVLLQLRTLLPSNNPPNEVGSSAEGSDREETEGTGQSEEPIVVDLDIPPGLAEFLDEKYPEKSPTQRTAENAASTASQVANDTAPNTAPDSPRYRAYKDGEDAEKPTSGTAEVDAQSPLGRPNPQEPGSLKLGADSPAIQIPSRSQFLGERTSEPDASVSANVQSPTPAILPALPTSDPPTMAAENIIEDQWRCCPLRIASTLLLRISTKSERSVANGYRDC